METTTMGYMGGCQNYGPFLGTLNIRCRITIGIQKGTIILTTTHIVLALSVWCANAWVRGSWFEARKGLL